MTDKEWLNKVTLAYNVYAKEVGPSLPVENFIEWIYKQYGIVHTKDLNDQ